MQVAADLKNEQRISVGKRDSIKLSQDLGLSLYAVSIWVINFIPLSVVCVTEDEGQRQLLVFEQMALEEKVYKLHQWNLLYVKIENSFTLVVLEKYCTSIHYQYSPKMK